MSGDEFEDITFEKTDLERVGQFREGPFDHEVILYRPDIMTVMGRDPTEKDDPLRLDPVQLVKYLPFNNAILLFIYLHCLYQLGLSHFAWT